MTPKDGNLPRWLHDHVSRAPDAPLYSFIDRQGEVVVCLTRQQLWFQAVSLAAGLQAAGWQRRPVLLCYPHGGEFLVAFWACLLAGVWPVPLPAPRSRDMSQLQAVLQHSQAPALLTTTALRPRLRELSAETPGSPRLLATDEGIDAAGVSWRMPQLREADIAFIQYTSGSTARPRGVRITHANVLCNLRQIAVAFNCSGRDTGLSWLPFHHDMGLIGHVLQPVFSELHNYFMSPSDFIGAPLSWLRALSRYRVTISGGPNFAYQWCLDRIKADEMAELDLSNWRLAYCGAEPVRAATLNAFARCFQPNGFARSAWYPCYGLAEATLFVAGGAGLRQSGCLASSTNRVVSCGSTAADLRLGIRDLRSKRWLGPGLEGEVCISAGSVSPGYYLDPEADRQRYCWQDGTRWLRSGDLGFIRDGQLHVTGRLSNSTKFRGRLLHAEDLEHKVLAVLPESLSRRCVALFNREPSASEPEWDLVLEVRPVRRAALEGRLRSRLMAGLVTAFGLAPRQILCCAPGVLRLTSSGKLRRECCRVALRADQLLPKGQRRFQPWC